MGSGTPFMSQAAKREKVRRFYRRHPEAYAKDFCNMTLTKEQRKACQLFVKHKRLAILASHGVGKSILAAMIINWFFDCFPDSVALSTAPTARQVKDVVWKEVRRLRGKRPGLMPKAPRMEASPTHYAVGYTSSQGDSFQGTHSPGGVLIVFDEAVGVAAPFFDATEGMLVDENCYWLAICNPTDPSCKLKEYCDKGKFHIQNISALNHPNVLAQLQGKAAPIKGAVTLDYVNRALKDWCTKIPIEIVTPLDVEFPAGSGNWYRPGPLFEGRVIGRWPTSSIDNVWSEAHYNGCFTPLEIKPEWELQIGVDVARFGDDFTTIWARRGPVVLGCMAYNGQSTTATRGFVIDMINKHVQKNEAAQLVPIKVDDNGIGGAVVDALKELDYNVIPVNASSAAFESESYPNRRTELWYGTRDRAETFELDFTRIDLDNLEELRRDLLAVKYKINSRGQRVIEDKDELKKRDRLGRSPDWADGLNLAFAPAFNPGEGRDLDAWS